MELKFLEKKFIARQEQNNDLCCTYLFKVRDELGVEKMIYIHISDLYIASIGRNKTLKEVEDDVKDYWSKIKSFEGVLGLHIRNNRVKIIYPKRI